MSDQPAPERVLVSGPLLQFVDGFRVDLLARGYSLWVRRSSCICSRM
ncbi:MAG: hypothetical protein ACR2LV_04680 [Solirubrobacteraceae bacterium]